MFETLQDFMSALDRAGELARVTERVSPVLEISAITDRESKRPAPNLPSASARRTDPRFHHLGGRALLFENVEGSDIPVLINAFGSYRRMELALGCHEPEERGLLPAPRVGRDAPGYCRGFEAWAEILGELVKPEPPSSIGEMLAKAKQLAPLLRMPPKRVRGGPCQEVVWQGDKVDLTRLPLIKCWPLDGDLASVGWPVDINDNVPGVEFARDENFRGRYITLGGIHTIHAEDAGNPRPPSRNIGMYRVQLLGRRTMAMHWHVHHDGARHWRSWKKRGEPMPVAIVLGGESVLPYAATAPLPPGLSEILLAGLLHGRGIEMCECVSVPLRVPANAEIVIEGYVSAEAGGVGFDPRDPSFRAGSGRDRTPDQSHQFGARSTERPFDRESGIRSLPLPALTEGGADSKALRSLLGPGAVIEGPFGDHTGFYSLPDRYPILTVTAITMRRNPIYPTTIVGLPPQEDYYMGKATERLFLPLLRTLVPDIVDYDLPMFGAFHNCAVLKIRKEYPLQARRVMHAIWGAGQMAWTKHVIVVDEDEHGKEIDVHDHAAVLRAVGERCDPSRDVETVRGPLDILDHAAPWLGAGTKMGFDATRKWGGAEGGGRKGTRHSALSMSPDRQSRERERAVGAAQSRGREHAGHDADVALRALRLIPGVLDVARPSDLGGAWAFVRLAAPEHVEGRQVAHDIFAALGVVHRPPAYIVLVSPEADVTRFDDALFHWCANSDPGRDRFVSADGRTAVFDATKKAPRSAQGLDGHDAPVRDYPPILRMTGSVDAALTPSAP